jgi:DNA-binding NarL/FixJ family response regulator
MQPQASIVHAIIADDHPLVRSGIRSLLSTIPGVEVLAEAGNGDELVEWLATIRADIVITDISMPGMDGLDALCEIHRRYPDTRVIVLSMHDDPETVRRAMRAGAAAYLRKDANGFELASAIHSVIKTGSYISAGVAKLLVHPGEPRAQDVLTERQLQILTLLATGESSKEIAFTLGISSKTVDVHRGRIMERLGMRDVASLTVYAVRKGLIKT